MPRGRSSASSTQPAATFSSVAAAGEFANEDAVWSQASTSLSAAADGPVKLSVVSKKEKYVFDGAGKYEAQWNNLHRPCGL